MEREPATASLNIPLVEVFIYTAHASCGPPALAYGTDRQGSRVCHRHRPGFHVHINTSPVYLAPNRASNASFIHTHAKIDSLRMKYYAKDLSVAQRSMRFTARELHQLQPKTGTAATHTVYGSGNGERKR